MMFLGESDGGFWVRVIEREVVLSVECECERVIDDKNDEN
jgi:hypothetical protein